MEIIKENETMLDILIKQGYEPSEALELLQGLDDLPVEEGLMANVEAWRPTTLEHVAWIIKKCHYIKKISDKNISIFDVEIEEKQKELDILKAKRQSVADKANKSIEFFKSRWACFIEDIVVNTLAGSKQRAIELTYGKVSLKKKTMSVELEKDVDLVSWAKSKKLKKIITIKESVSKTDLKNYMQDNNLNELKFGSETIATLVGGYDELKIEVE